MTTKEYLIFHNSLCEQARHLSASKNHDYSGASGLTPFANFQRVEAMGVCSVEQGFLVRMLDKLARLTTYTKEGKLLVADEGVKDTLVDLINYSCLFAAYLEEKRQNEKQQ